MAAKNRPPLIIAVWTKNIVKCRRLIDTGEANVDGDRTQYGSTALHIASVRGYLEIAELLTSSGADMNIRNDNGWTALHVASFGGHLEIVQLLLCQGADVSIRSNAGRTAQDLVSSGGHLKTVAECLRKWPWTMAIIALQDMDTYKYLDFSSFEDLWQY